MRLINLDIQNNNKIYSFSQLAGALLESNHSDKQSQVILPAKLTRQLAFCNQPYTLAAQQITKHTPSITNAERKYANILTRLCKHSFIAARWYTKLHAANYANAQGAIGAYRSMLFGKAQSELCLPRTLFAASKSIQFKHHGVIFIGVFLPSKSMHAWIIEDGTQPDPLDTIWTNYQPVAALV